MPRLIAPLIFVICLIACVLAQATAQPSSVTSAVADEPINLHSRVGDVELFREDGQLFVNHNDGTYTAEQYLALIETQQHRRDAGGPLFKLFNITTLFGVVWVGLGLLGQLLFTGRMLVQWMVSEKEKRSVVPPIFWYMSLAGASLLLVYFIWRKDIVGILGQATGWMIYARNVYLIRRSNSARSGMSEGSAQEDAPVAN